jgi:hypothetical protein
MYWKHMRGGRPHLRNVRKAWPETLHSYVGRSRNCRSCCATDSPPSRQELAGASRSSLEEALSHIEAGEKQAVRHYAELERRLLDIENSRFLRTLQWPGRFLGDWKGRLGQLLLHSPLHPLYLKLVHPHFTADRYRLWVESERAPVERRARPATAHQPDFAGAQSPAPIGWRRRLPRSSTRPTAAGSSACATMPPKDWVAEYFTP